MIVTVDEMKVHLRVEDDAEDEYIATLIKQGQAVAEDYCRSEFSEPIAEPVRLAVMLFVSFYFENRDAPDRTAYNTMRVAFQNLLYPYRDIDKMF